MRIVATVQARMASKRLPGKVMKQLGNQSVVSLLLKRLSQSKNLSEIVVAISDSSSDDPLAEHLSELGFPVFRGAESDVLSRCYLSVENQKADIVVRVTADCPFVDPIVVDAVIDFMQGHGADYASNIIPPTFPDGLDVEVIKYRVLRECHNRAVSKYDREHVTPFIQRSKNYVKVNYINDEDLSDIRLTLDTKADYDRLKAIVEHPEFNEVGTLGEIMKIVRTLGITNYQSSQRNEGLLMNSGQKLWTRAKQLIPGGNMLLSKRAEMFTPENWPSYFSKARGCEVWDLDNKRYIDVSLMGVGTNLLGYGHPEVDNAVRKVIDSGNMSTLNAPEEVYLAEKLVDMHEFADMARFCRSGGEANAVAIRIARAATGKDKVAICGYHGWHDWYLATNLASVDGLNKHLLPGLSTQGVPEGLKGTVLPFEYNNISELEKIIQQNDLAAIKMEPIRNTQPMDNFLQKVRALASKNNIVLIFDECTTGFRQSFGGIHKIYGVEPDVAIFGKALGNGYAISAIIGCESVMDAANDTFISSTFWTERIGSVAALKTLEIMERERSWKRVTDLGNLMRAHWSQLSKNNGIDITLNGIPPLSSFVIEHPDALKFKTLITQEMLKKGYLASNVFYASCAHDDDLLNVFAGDIASVFEKIGQCVLENINVNELIDGPVCHSGFARLN